MELKPKYAKRVHPNATMLLRPEDGPQGHDRRARPGHARAGRRSRTATRSRSRNTQPDVNLDEILAVLDGDTRTYLQLLLNGAATGLEGNGATSRRSSAASSRPRATPPSSPSCSRSGASTSAARSTTSASSRTRSRARPAARRRSSTARTQVFQHFANQDANLQRTIALLPAALRDTNRALAQAKAFADQAGPALGALRPGARALGPSLVATRPFLRETTPIIREPAAAVHAESRRRSCKELRPAAAEFADATPDLDDDRSTSSTRSSTGSRTTRRAAARATCSTSPGSTTSRTRSSPRRTRRGRSAVASLVDRLRLDLPGVNGIKNPQSLVALRAYNTCGSLDAAANPPPDCRTCRTGTDACRSKHPPSVASSSWRASRSPASACCSTCGSRSAAASRSSRRATASTIHFGEATQLAQQADVRISGVPVGKVVDARARPGPDDGRDDPARRALRADPERRARDPALEDAARRDVRRADARPQERRDAARGRRAARRAGLQDGRARRDLPLARPAHAPAPSRSGCSRSRSGIDGRGQDLNSAFGNLAPFAEDTNDAAARRSTSRTRRSSSSCATPASCSTRSARAAAS